MLANLKDADATDLFDIHLHVTDPPTGALPPLTSLGRPDWHAELAGIRDRHDPDDVDVFYCGPRALSQTLHAHCRALGWRFTEEHF